jgi:hypothetical protein
MHHVTLHCSVVFDAATPICCHIGRFSVVITMTERDKGM